MSGDVDTYLSMLPGKLAAHLDGPWAVKPPGPLERAVASRIRQLATDNMNLRGALSTTEDFGRLLIAMHEPLQRLVEMGPVHLETAVNALSEALSPAAVARATSEPLAEFVPDPKVRAADVSAADKLVTLYLSDGRRLSAPLHWFPRLHYANADQRANWEIAGGGYGVHWPDVDEDISVRALMGRPT